MTSPTLPDEVPAFSIGWHWYQPRLPCCPSFCGCAL